MIRALLLLVALLAVDCGAELAPPDPDAGAQDAGCCPPASAWCCPLPADCSDLTACCCPE